tara:strand:- start:1655 stop:3103 length:1449 start_codon:yes stop_codon:yes gene_type:complete
MKWIGQHIYDLIARFRSDVYLEDISTGTIASGGNLGLDSDNKIVKASASGGGIAFDGSTANGVLTYKDSDEATVESNLTFDGSTLNLTGDLTVEGDTITLQSDNADDPKIVIQNNYNNNQGARLQMKKNRGAAQVNGDNISEVDFFGEDADQNQAQYGKILMKTDEVTNGQESGDMRFQVAAHDATLTQGLKLVGGSQSGEVDVTVGAGTASVTTIAGTLTVGSTDFVNNSGVIQVATQGTIDHDSLANFVAAEHIDWAGASAGTIHSSNIPTLNQDTTGNATTATNLVASTSTAVQLGTIELGHASDTTIARSAAGVATIEGKKVQTRDKVIFMETSNFNDDLNTDAHYIPFITTSEHPYFSNIAVPFVAPTAGKLLGVHYRSNVHTNTSSNTVTFRLDRLDDGVLWANGNEVTIGTKVVDGTARENTCSADFQDLTTAGASGTNAFDAGEMIGVSMQNSQNLTSTKYSVTIVFEFDYNSY